MAHARYSDLDDLATLLAKIRSLPGIQEPRPGIFYLKRTPFLHFHTRAGARWADAKAGQDWGPEIPLPFALSAAESEAAWACIQERYQLTMAHLNTPRTK
jgi:hypothetical protein